VHHLKWVTRDADSRFRRRQWFGWPVPGLVCAGVVLVLGLVMLGVAIAEFSRVE
jgi:hypothetical protein